MKKLIISALCLIRYFIVCIQPVYADDSDNVKTGDRKVDAFGNRIDDDKNSQPKIVRHAFQSGVLRVRRFPW